MKGMKEGGRESDGFEERERKRVAFALHVWHLREREKKKSPWIVATCSCMQQLLHACMQEILVLNYKVSKPRKRYVQLTHEVSTRNRISLCIKIYTASSYLKHYFIIPSYKVQFIKCLFLSLIKNNKKAYFYHKK